MNSTKLERLRETCFYEHDYIYNQLEYTILQLMEDYNIELTENEIDFMIECFLINIENRRK